MGTLAARGAAFVTAVILARYFEPATFAVLLLAQAASQYLAIALDFGLTLGGIRMVANRPGMVRSAMGAVLFIRTALGFAGVLAVWMATVLLQLDATSSGIFVLFALATAVAALDLSWVAQGHQSTALRALVLAGSSGLALAVLIVALSIHPDPLVAPTAQLIGVGPVVVIGISVIARRYGGPLVPNRAVLATIVRSAVPIGMATLLAQVYYNLDLLLLGVFRTLQEVASYGAMYKIILALLMLGWAYALAVLPRLTLASDAGTHVLRAEIALRLRHLAAGVVPLVIGIMVLAEPVLVATFGPAYGDAAAPFSVLLASVPVSAAGSLLLYSLVAAGRNWALPLSSGCGAILNLLLNLILIPPFGMMGAAWATLAAVALVLALAAFNARPFLPSLRWDHLGRLGAGGVVVAVVVYLGRDLPLVPVAAIAGISYVLATLRLGLWRPDERAMMRALPGWAFKAVHLPHQLPQEEDSSGATRESRRHDA
jgi:O-antigen/teichoic acid export membrane protein